MWTRAASYRVTDSDEREQVAVVAEGDYVTARLAHDARVRRYIAQGWFVYAGTQSTTVIKRVCGGRVYERAIRTGTVPTTKGGAR